GDFFFSSRRRHTRFSRDWSSDVCSSDLLLALDPGDDRRERADRDADDEQRLDEGREQLLHQAVPPPSGRPSGGSESKSRPANARSEERRVGKEWRSRRVPYHRETERPIA